jgi:hypothetical protein
MEIPDIDQYVVRQRLFLEKSQGHSIRTVYRHFAEEAHPDKIRMMTNQ